jgi:hypothetical protein
MIAQVLAGVEGIGDGNARLLQVPPPRQVGAIGSQPGQIYDLAHEAVDGDALDRQLVVARGLAGKAAKAGRRRVSQPITPRAVVGT